MDNRGPALRTIRENRYRDGVDMTKDQFFERLLKDPVHPALPNRLPRTFVETYKKLDPDNNDIISIHIARKMSGTCNSADQASSS
jgi:fatty acid-binding protein DegV